MDVFAEFQKNIEPLKALVRSAVRDAPTGECPHCRVHAGVTLPVELP